MVLHGGWESGPNRYPRDTWTLADLDGTPTWSRPEPASEAPQRRFFGVGAYDAPTRRLLAFGGGTGASALKDVAALTLDGPELAWHGVAPRTPVTARDQAATAYADGRLFAFGGFGSGTFPGAVDAGTHLADSARLRLGRDGGRWRPATPPTGAPNPLHREAAAFTTDTRRDRLIIAGGLEGDEELADVWAADLRAGSRRWRQLCTPVSCGPGPQARWGGVAVYDRAGDRIVVFGGRRSDGTSLGDVWQLSLSGAPRWTPLAVAGEAPPPRWGAAAGLDPIGRRMIVAGGQSGPDAAATPYADAWALSLDGAPAWERLTPAGAGPEARRSAAYAMRVRGGVAELLVTGGFDPVGRVHFNDVWSLALTAGGATWTQRAASDCAAAALPTCRRSASAVVDPRRDRLVLAFGRDGARFFGDTWTFGLADGRWRPFADALGPRRRERRPDHAAQPLGGLLELGLRQVAERQPQRRAAVVADVERRAGHVRDAGGERGGPQRHRVEPAGQREPGEEPAGRLRPRDARGHVPLQRGRERGPVRRVERPRGRQVALEAARAAVLLDEPLAQPAGALVGVLLRRDELGDHVGRPGRPAQPHAGEERLRERAGLEDETGRERPQARQRSAVEGQLAVGDVLDDQHAVAVAERRSAHGGARAGASGRSGSGTRG